MNNSLSARSRKRSHSVLPYLTLAIFLCIFACLGLIFFNVPGPWNWIRQALTGALAALLIVFGVTEARGGGWRPRFVDVAVLAWLIWESTAPFFARAPYEALEGFRDIVLAGCAFWTGTMVLGRQYWLTAGILIVAAVVFAGLVLYQPLYSPFPAMPAPWLGIAFFLSLGAAGRQSWPRWPRRLLKILLLLVMFALVAIYVTRLHQSREGAEQRLRWQESFERSTVASRLFMQHPIRGVGRGNFSWHDRALRGRPPVVQAHAWRHPWPHVATSGIVSLGFMLIIALTALAKGRKTLREQNQISFPLLGLQGAVLVWAICGIIGGFLFHSLGLFVAFALLGTVCAIAESIDSDNLASGEEERDEEEPVRKSAAGIYSIAGYSLLTAFFVILFIVPEISGWLAWSAPASPSPVIRLHLSRLIYPISPHPWFVEAEVLRTENERREISAEARKRAIIRYHGAIKRNPLNAEYYLRLASWLESVPGESKKAGELLKRAFRYCPGSYELAVRLADYYESSGNYRDALMCLERFDEKRPFDMELHQRLVNYYTELGMMQRAARHREQLVLIQKTSSASAGI